ncbi:hypothetical protein C2E25_11170 [Geothermobacter hydrogeniphilus]|uniref:Uncharacterized protein n=1 Tax=Geothermobacter hydrogeniphilus TaxID=1969733 RepID=A0A2K2H8V6_9BACT|nr:hypothetical protein [Geothermobacter hydrogeniphilus]PNU19748.1 hypothetical protein C2E25_11170 [Geothermobacter hydrogeniphilus]
MSNFEQEFLENYLKFGLGSMPKSDIDALVMHLLDRFGVNSSGPLSNYSNQAVSERLKTPVNKIKKLRYDAALKFGGRIEDQAMGRLLAALANATLESDGKKICLIIEDSLAKNWLQGQLKNNQIIFDYSFNTEIVKVSTEGLFNVLDSLFDNSELEIFKKRFEEIKKQENSEKRKNEFKDIVKKFAEGAAKAAGSGVVSVLKTHLGML